MYMHGKDLIASPKVIINKMCDFYTLKKPTVWYGEYSLGATVLYPPFLPPMCVIL